MEKGIEEILNGVESLLEENPRGHTPHILIVILTKTLITSTIGNVTKRSENKQGLLEIKAG